MRPPYPFVIVFFLLLGTGAGRGGEGEDSVFRIDTRNPLVRASRGILSTQRPPVYSFGKYAPDLGFYDCSSFVVEVVKRIGKGSFPRSSRGQFRLLSQTGQVWLRGDQGWGGLRAGDFVFFSGTFRHRHACPVSHVMIYAGDGLMIGAQPTGVGFFRFQPSEPFGRPGFDNNEMRTKETVYAYARPD